MRLTTLFFICLVFIISCSKSDPKPSPIVPPVIPVDSPIVKTDTTEDVYIVGYKELQAGYWKNSQFVALATGYYPFAIDMAFSGNDIYVLGQANDSIGFWKNGQFNFLARADTLIATSIAVSGTDVYCLLQDVSRGTGFLFKNKNLFSQVLTHSELETAKLYFNGSDLYIPGSNNNVPSSPVYWKNGVVNPLPKSTDPGCAYGIALDGTDVYAVGYTFYSKTSTDIATYWKNDVAFYLTDSASYGKISYITVQNGQVYMAGYVAAGNQNGFTGPSSVFIWKNGIATTLTPVGYSDELYGFAVNGSDVYVSVVSKMTGSSNVIKRYYKNGVPVVYPTTTNSLGARIFVRPR